MAFPGNGRLPAIEDELRRLRAENKRLLAERDILKNLVVRQPSIVG
jgi:transposase